MKLRSTGGEDPSDANEERKTSLEEKKQTYAFLSCPAVQLSPPVTFLQSVGRTRVSCGTALKRVRTRQANSYTTTLIHNLLKESRM